MGLSKHAFHYSVIFLGGDAKCECLPGYSGRVCTHSTTPTTFLPQSYVKFALSFDPDHFHTEIQLRFRSRESSGELFRVSDQHARVYAILEVSKPTTNFYIFYFPYFKFPLLNFYFFR